MRQLVAMAAMLAAALAALPASAGRAGLPPPLFSTPGSLVAVAVAGPRLAIASTSYATGCTIRLATPARAVAPVVLKGPRVCVGEAGADDYMDGLWLGRTALAVIDVHSPSPHGDDYSLWTAPLPSGPFRQVGVKWGWTDSDYPPIFDCAQTVVAGGGIVAFASGPNRLTIENAPAEPPACPAKNGGTTVIHLLGSSRPATVVEGSWMLLATDGKRFAMSRLDAKGRPDGDVELVGLDGAPIAAAGVDADTGKAARYGWLAPEGLVLRTSTGLVGPGWKLPGVRAATVAYGRVLYLLGRTVHVRRIDGDGDRVLTTLPTREAGLAAGSFGLAIALQQTESRGTIHRIPWSTIDKTLPQK